MKTWEEYYPEDKTNGFGFVTKEKEEFRKYFFETGRPETTGGRLMTTVVRRDKGIRSVDWNCEGRYYASGTKDGYLVVQDLAKMLERGRTVVFEVAASDDRHGLEVSNVRWHPHDPSIVATVAGEKLKIWDIRQKSSEACIASADFRTAEGKSAGHGLNLRWHPTAQQVYVGTSDDWMMVYSFNMDSKKFDLLTTYKFNYVVNEFDIDPSGGTLIACNETGAIDTFSLPSKTSGTPGISQQSKKTSMQCHSVSVFSIDVDPQGRFFAIGSADSIVSFMTLRFESMGCFSVCRDEIRSITFSHDGELTCVASKNELYIVHTMTQKLPELPPGENYYAARWHPKRYVLLYCTDSDHDSGNVYFWVPNAEAKEIRESNN